VRPVRRSFVAALLRMTKKEAPDIGRGSSEQESEVVQVRGERASRG
jgi:hypothetical protein